MQIRSIDVHDDAEFHAFHTAEEAAFRHERPFAGFWTEQEATAAFRNPDGFMRMDAYAAFVDGEVVGVVHAMFPLNDNTEKVHFSVSVPPAFRRRGYGTALVEHVVGRARAEGRTVLIGDTHIPTGAGEEHPHRRFAAACGFRLANTDIHRVRDLPVPDDQIQSWVDEAAPHHADYEITSFVDELPDQLVPSYVHLLNQLIVDAPTGEIEFEEGAMTVETFHAQARSLRDQGRTIFHTVATVGAGEAREAVAHSVIACPPDGADEPHLYQWATLVRRDHRGHRLGMATKAHNLRLVQKARPERTILHTHNAETNGPMVAINERMGFRPVETGAEYLRELD